MAALFYDWLESCRKALPDRFAVSVALGQR
jgi:hypothetical protein